MYKYLQRNKKMLILFLLCTPIAVFFETNLATVIKWITDAGVHRKIDMFWKLIFISVIYVVLYILFYHLYRTLRFRLTKNASKELRDDLYKSIFRLRISSFEEGRDAHYSSILINNIPNFEGDYFANICHGYYLLLSFVLSLSMLIKINIFIAIIIVIFASLQLIVPMIFEEKIVAKKNLFLEANKNYLEHVVEKLRGFTIVKIFNSQKKFILLHDQASKNVSKSDIDSKVFNEFVFNITFLLSTGMYLGTMLLGIYLTFINKVTIGEVVAASQLMAFVSGAMESFTSIFTELKSSKPLENKFNEVLSIEEEKNKIQGIDTNTFFLKYTDVNFSYREEEKKVLKNFNYSFQHNNKYLIYGSSGSGKSTMAKLLEKDFIGYKGVIELSGVDIQEIDDEYYYETIGFNDQEMMIFKDSILNNITMYQNYEKEEIDWVIDFCEIKDIIVNRERGLDTVIGEDGYNLSGGEKQRIALARVLIKKPKIICLDEPTSKLDNITARIIEEKIFTLKDTMVLFITHRKDRRIEELANDVLVFREGRVEYGL